MLNVISYKSESKYSSMYSAEKREDQDDGKIKEEIADVTEALYEFFWEMAMGQELQG